MKKKKDRKLLIKRSILLLLSVLVFLFVLELVFRSTYSSYANYNTEMWRYASELKQISGYPDLGHEHVPNKTELLYGAEIKTNSIGLRSETEYRTPKPKDTIRVLVLGDSITLGWGVNNSDTYTYILESLIKNQTSKNVEVINTGVGNYNSQSELAALKKFLFLEPDIIILGFYINDIETVNYPNSVGYFFAKNSYLYSFVMDKVMNIKYRGDMDYKNYYLRLYKDKEMQEKLKKTIFEMAEIAEKKSIPFIFANIPEFHQFEDYPFLDVNELIEEEIIKNKNITYINLLPTFQEKSIPPEELWVSGEDPHPNAEGQRIIAEGIYGSVFPFFSQ